MLEATRTVATEPSVSVLSPSSFPVEELSASEAPSPAKFKPPSAADDVPAEFGSKYHAVDELKAYEKFQHYDTDGNGFLDSSEVVALAVDLYEAFHGDRTLTDSQIQEVHDKLLQRMDERDGNKDGMISFEEFLPWYAQAARKHWKLKHGLSDDPHDSSTGILTPLDTPLPNLAVQRPARLGAPPPISEQNTTNAEPTQHPVTCDACYDKESWYGHGGADHDFVEAEVTDLSREEAAQILHRGLTEDHAVLHGTKRAVAARMNNVIAVANASIAHSRSAEEALKATLHAAKSQESIMQDKLAAYEVEHRKLLEDAEQRKAEFSRAVEDEVQVAKRELEGREQSLREEIGRLQDQNQGLQESLKAATQLESSWVRSRMLEALSEEASSPAQTGHSPPPQAAEGEEQQQELVLSAMNRIDGVEGKIEQIAFRIQREVTRLRRETKLLEEENFGLRKENQSLKSMSDDLRSSLKAQAENNAILLRRSQELRADRGLEEAVRQEISAMEVRD